VKDVAVGILRKNGLVLACQRKKTALYPLQWEFPGGKIETGETPTDALIRELHEELGIFAIHGEELHRQEWSYGDASYRVYYYSVQAFRGELTNQAFETIRWVTPEELRNMDILEGNREVVERLSGKDEIATPEEGSQ
jgi:mutator protein MutT